MIKKIIRAIYYGPYSKFFGKYPVELRKAVGNCKTLLDVGCGSHSPIRFFREGGGIKAVGVDVYAPAIKESQSAGIHEKYYCMNILNMDKKFKKSSFDCVLASGVIEHLTKAQGEKLIALMEKIAGKAVILSMPNGFVVQGELEGNPYQVHRSGWTVKEMKDKGYRVVGYNGWKGLKGGYPYWPKIFWRPLSDLTQFFVRNRPEHAYEILCIKRMRPASASR
jgi:hypothetical protein